MFVHARTHTLTNMHTHALAEYETCCESARGLNVHCRRTMQFESPFALCVCVCLHQQMEGKNTREPCLLCVVSRS